MKIYMNSTKEGFENRNKIMQIMGDKEIYAGDIKTEFNIDHSGIAKHLNYLHDAGFLSLKVRINKGKRTKYFRVKNMVGWNDFYGKAMKAFNAPKYVPIKHEIPKGGTVYLNMNKYHTGRGQVAKLSAWAGYSSLGGF